MNNNKIYEEITEKIVSSLEKGVVPWKQPWIGGGMPVNHKGTAYNGVNAVILNLTATECNFKSNKWFTFKQVSDLNESVKKGSTATTIIYWNFKIIDEENEIKKIPYMKFYKVFNQDQTTIKEKELKEITPILDAELIIENYKNKPIINHEIGNVAAYSKKHDTITMPERNQFSKDFNYYSVLFHEMVHSTGHEKRLNRFVEQNNKFGSEEYSKEELIAEIGSSFLSGICGFNEKTLEQNSSYINGWLKVLKNDKKLLMTASTAAQKAVNYIQGEKNENNIK